MRFRVKAIAKDTFVVQERFLFFWITCQESQYGECFCQYFPSEAAAEEYIKNRRKAEKEAEKLAREDRLFRLHNPPKEL